jgi:uncharacterized membrane protein
MFYREGLLAPRPTPKLEDHPLSAVHDCLFNLFAATLHIGGRSSIRNLRKRHAVVTGTHYTWKGGLEYRNWLWRVTAHTVATGSYVKGKGRVKLLCLRWLSLFLKLV